MKFPSVEPGLSAARAYLCAKNPTATDLEAFAAAIRSFRTPREEIEAKVAAQVEFLHNTGRLTGEKAKARGAALLSYYLGHEKRLKDITREFIRGRGLPEREAALLSKLEG